MCIQHAPVGCITQVSEVSLILHATLDRLELLKERLEHLEAKAAKVSSPTMEPHGKNGHVYDRVAENAITCAMVRKCIASDAKPIAERITEFKSLLARSPLNEQAVRVLWLKYVRRKKWPEVARELSMPCRDVLMLADEATNLLAEWLDELPG